MCLNKAYPISLKAKANSLVFKNSIVVDSIIKEDGFFFLNKLYQCHDEDIDWNFSAYGKLWTYNLTYFDYLQQVDMTEEDGLRLINDFIDQSASIKDGLMPFPISLRGINWIKFLSRHKIQDQKVNDRWQLFHKVFPTFHQILLDKVGLHNRPVRGLKLSRDQGGLAERMDVGNSQPKKRFVIVHGVTPVSLYAM